MSYRTARTPERKTLSPIEAARVLGLGIDAVRLGVRTGAIHSLPRGVSGKQRVIPMAEVERLLSGADRPGPPVVTVTAPKAPRVARRRSGGTTVPKPAGRAS